MFTNVAGKPLSAPEYRPLFARMVQHDLPVWIHPMRAAQFSDYATEKESQNEIWFSFGWPYETTACMTRLIYSGIFDEMPTLKIVSHHMGGMIPYFSGKIQLGFRQIFFGAPEKNPVAAEAGLKKPPVEYFKMLYADTALGEVAPTRCGHAFFGTKQCLFASDAPFDSEQGRGLLRRSIEAVEGAGDFAGGEGCDLCGKCEEAVEAIGSRPPSSARSAKAASRRMGGSMRSRRSLSRCSSAMRPGKIGNERSKCEPKTSA